MKYKVGDIVFSTIWKKSVLIKDIRPNRFYLIADLEYLSRTMVTYESNLKSREDDVEKDMEEHQKIVDEIMTTQGIEPIEAEMEEVWHCPEGYIFKDENGNVINATKIVLEKKKKEYPKTFEECCKILGLLNVDLCFNADYRSFDASKEQWKRLGLMNQFYQLLICRDAYWKIAGEEMGLGKPWESNDADYVTGRYCIFVHRGNIICSTPAEDCPFTFPTEEMRDAFYDNFKSEIEQCKELL